MNRIVPIALAIVLALASATSAQPPPRPVGPAGTLLLEQSKKLLKDLGDRKKAAGDLALEQQGLATDNASLRKLEGKVNAEGTAIDEKDKELDGVQKAVGEAGRELTTRWAGLGAVTATINRDVVSLSNEKRALAAEKAALEAESKTAKGAAARKRLGQRQEKYDKRRGKHDKAVQIWKGLVERQEKDVMAYFNDKDQNAKDAENLKEGRKLLQARKVALTVERGELKRKSKDFEDKLTGLNARKETHKGHWGVAQGQAEQQMRNLGAAIATLGGEGAALRGAREQMRKALDDARKAEEERQRLERGLFGRP